MPRRVATVAVYGPWGRVSGRQSQAAGLLPLSKRAAAKSCFGQECVATVCRWVRDGIIPAKRFGKRIIKIPCVEVERLVFEIICMFPVTQADAKAACKGFH